MSLRKRFKTVLCTVRLEEVTILLAACFPILPFYARSTSLAFLLILAFFNVKKSCRTSAEYIQFMAMFGLAYLALALSLFVSTDLNTGFNELGQLAPLLIVPLSFLFLKDYLSAQVVNRFVWVFVLSTFLLTTYQVIHIGLNWNGIFGPITESEIVSFNLDLLPAVPEYLTDRVMSQRLRTFTIDLTGTHPTYQALWLAASVYFLFKRFFIKPAKNWYCLIFVILAFGWVYFIGSRMGQIAMILVLLGTTYTQIKSFKIKAVAWGCFAVALWLASNHPRFQEIAEGLNPSISVEHIAHYNSSNVRLAVWRCSIETIKHNPWFGTGVGDIQPKLNACYKSNFGALVFTWSQYNTHNQFLHFWAATGIFGLILFVFQLGVLMKGLKKSHYFDGWAIFALAVLFMLTENILVRSDGIHFFSTFMALYVYAKR